MEIFTRYYDNPIVLKRALDITHPTEISRNTALFFVHGGGWHAGGRDNYHEMLMYFADRGYISASAGYRLVPAVKLDSQISDVACGYGVFLDYIEKNAPNVNRIIVIGSSAGAHLASMLALACPGKFCENTGNAQRWIRPSACVSVNGPATLEDWPGMEATIRKSIEDAAGAVYGEDTKEVFKSLSPMTYVCEDSPDFIFLLAGKEKYFPHYLIYEMSEKLKKFGKTADVHVFEEALHGFFYFLRSELQLKALAVLEEFIDRY